MRFLTIFTLLFLAACGQTGKLYLPDSVPAEPVTTAPAAETAESASPDKAEFEAELKSQPSQQQP
ncbi:MAG: LPS translocon maturation chaperone LptM [Pseudomonadales bacterium]|jgi:predicted small lipoprotein YifL